MGASENCEFGSDEIIIEARVERIIQLEQCLKNIQERIQDLDEPALSANVQFAIEDLIQDVGFNYIK